MKGDKTKAAEIEKLVAEFKQLLSGYWAFGGERELPAKLPASPLIQKAQVAINAARHGDIAPLRDVLTQAFGPDIAEFIHLPKRKRGTHERDPWFRETIVEAAQYESRAGTFLKKRYEGRSIPITAGQFVAQVFGVDPNDIATYREAQRKKTARLKQKQAAKE